FRKTKVEQDDLAAPSQFHVLRLDVAVNDLRILCMQIVERVQQLVRPCQNLIGRKWSSFASHHLRQIVTGDELHHEKLAVAFGKMVADARQRRMMQTRQKSGLSFKLLSQTLVRKQRLF